MRVILKKLSGSLSLRVARLKERSKTPVAVDLKTYGIIRADVSAVETSHTSGIIDISRRDFYTLGRADIFAFHATDTPVGVDFYMVKCIIAKASESSAYWADVGTKTATGK